MSSSKIQCLPEKPWKTTEDAEFYHGFTKNQVVWGALHYIQFKRHGKVWWGKIQSVWKEKPSGRVMLEIQPFQYVPESQQRCDAEDYDELYAVLDSTEEIPAEWVCNHECSLCHVPPHVKDSGLVDYTEMNIGLSEYDTAKEDEELRDENGDGFIVEGEAWGFYQYAVPKEGEGVVYAPSPQFVDLIMSYTKVTNWMASPLVKYIQRNFKQRETDKEKEVEFYRKMGHLLTSEDSPPVSSLYASCLSFQYGV